jgi:hypothetical protein
MSTLPRQRQPPTAGTHRPSAGRADLRGEAGLPRRGRLPDRRVFSAGSHPSATGRCSSGCCTRSRTGWSAQPLAAGHPPSAGRDPRELTSAGSSTIGCSPCTCGTSVRARSRGHDGANSRAYRSSSTTPPRGRRCWSPACGRGQPGDVAGGSGSPAGGAARRSAASARCGLTSSRATSQQRAHPIPTLRKKGAAMAPTASTTHTAPRRIGDVLERETRIALITRPPGPRAERALHRPARPATPDRPDERRRGATRARAARAPRRHPSPRRPYPHPRRQQLIDEQPRQLACTSATEWLRSTPLHRRLTRHASQ